MYCQSSSGFNRQSTVITSKRYHINIILTSCVSTLYVRFYIPKQWGSYWDFYRIIFFHKNDEEQNFDEVTCFKQVILLPILVLWENDIHQIWFAEIKIMVQCPFNTPRKKNHLQKKNLHRNRRTFFGLHFTKINLRVR